jgi:flagellar biosynthesis component FlhA
VKLVEDLIFYLLAFLGVLIMFIGVINMLIIEMKNKKSEQKKSKLKYVKLLIGGLIVFIVSRILHGQIL